MQQKKIISLLPSREPGNFRTNVTRVFTSHESDESQWENWTDLKPHVSQLAVLFLDQKRCIIYIYTHNWSIWVRFSSNIFVVISERTVFFNPKQTTRFFSRNPGTSTPQKKHTKKNRAPIGHCVPMELRLPPRPGKVSRT